MSDIYQVVTPENVELDYEIAGIGSRFIASAIDLTLQLFLFSGAAYALHLLNLEGLQDRVGDYLTSIAGGLIAFGSVLVLFIGYYVILETVWNGQSIGKKIVHIRVRKEGGYAPSFWDILLRNIIRLIDFFPFFYGVGFLVMFLNDKSKRLGDFAAATIVVKEMPRKQFAKYLENSSHPAKHDEAPGPHPVDPLLNTLVPLIRPADYLIMKNLMARRSTLDNYPTLAASVIQNILSRINPSEQTSGNNGILMIPDQAARLLPELIALYEKLCNLS